MSHDTAGAAAYTVIVLSPRRRAPLAATRTYQALLLLKRRKLPRCSVSPLFHCLNHCRRLAAFFSPQAVPSMDDANSEPMVMPFDLLRELTDGFSEVRKLGSGSYGKGVHQDGKKIAVKKLYDMPGLDDDQFQNEFKIFARLRHQNIVRLVGYCHDIHEVHIKHEGKLVLAEKTHRALCLEYMSNGSLAKYLSDDCDRYDWHTGYRIIKGISQGLKYLHKEIQPHIYHLDLKPDNVLLDENMVPRIADFGMSKLFKDEHTRATNSPLGTIGYLPPEYIHNNLISNKFDIFSLGVMIIKIMAGVAGYFRIADMPSQAFINLVHESWMNRLRGASNLMKAYSEQLKICIEIGLSCVQVDRHKRPTIQDIIDRLNETETKCTDASIKDWLLIYQDCYIPDYLLKPECQQVIVDHAPLCPVVVFINSTSGCQLGSILIKTCRELLNGAQVFDLSEEAPDKVLHRLYANFEKLKCQGDTLAIQIQRNLRLIAAGGDGTANWLLGVVSDLRLCHPPPVAVVPLGTENNLALSLGWGKKNPATDQQAVKSLLEQVKGAREMNIDSWHVMLRLRVPQEGPCDPIRPLELPDSLHELDHVSDCSHLNMNGYHTFHGGFWSSFSMGLDAQVSYNFHSARKFHPEKFIDKGTYDKLGRKQGWFAASPSQPSSRNIGHLAKVKVMKRPGHHWEELMIPYSTRSVVCLNLPSFSGGLDPWGEPGTKTRDRDLTASYADDGLIEVVGFSKAWHGIDLLAPNGHGSRLAQVYRIRFEFHKGAGDHTFMEIDGKPWRQPLPCEDETVTVEISHCHQVTVLVNDPCRSKSVADPDCDSLEDEDEWEERKKFGAADSFKISDEVDIAHLS